MKTRQRQGKLYLVGVGPGDPELMTVRAVRILEQVPVWLVPNGNPQQPSHALQIAARMVATTDKTIEELHFPMRKVALGHDKDPAVVQGWEAAARAVLVHIDAGREVAFPTLGDPGLYSTAFYLLAMLQELRPALETVIIPGITAMAACSAGVGVPLALGDDVVAIVPAAFGEDRLRQMLISHDVVVLMKVFRRLPQVIGLLDELGLAANAVLIERCGLPGQRIFHDIHLALDRQLHYFTTLIVRRYPLEHIR